MRAPIGPTSVGIRPPCRGSTANVRLYRCLTSINLGFKSLTDAGLVRMVPALSWLPCLRSREAPGEACRKSSGLFLFGLDFCSCSLVRISKSVLF